MAKTLNLNLQTIQPLNSKKPKIYILTKKIQNMFQYEGQSHQKHILKLTWALCACVLSCFCDIHTVFDPTDYSPPGSSVHGML